MNLKEILNALEISGEIRGDDRFETLGLANAVCHRKMLTFIENEKYIPTLSKDAALLLTTPRLAALLSAYNICCCGEPRKTFFAIHNYLAGSSEYRRGKQPTQIGANCEISPLAYIAPQNVQIGDNTVIEEFVSIKENVTIGDNCIIRAGTIVGGEGFEQKRSGDVVMGVIHLGGVVIGNHVELQQNNTVDKAVYPWDDTQIGDYCKTDNMVHIAHAVKMKKRILIAAQTCVAGRVNIDDDAWIGPGVTIINGVSIGERARVNIGSTATRDVPAGQAVTGNFAIDHQRFIENLKQMR